jgi:hypothetical protein
LKASDRTNAGYEPSEEATKEVDKGMVLVPSNDEIEELDRKRLNQSFPVFSPYFFLNRSILPAVSKNFCFP